MSVYHFSLMLSHYMPCCCCCSLRDELLDAARDVADEDEEAAEKLSLGQALQQALEQRLSKPAEAAAGNGSADAAANGEVTAAAAADNKESKEAVKQEGDQQQQQQPEATAEAANDAAGEADAEAAASTEPNLDAAAETAADTKEQPKAEAADASGTAAGAAAEAKADAAGDAEGAGAAPKVSYTAEQLELLDWHWANLEYGCSASLTEVSLPHWNQVRPPAACKSPAAIAASLDGAACWGESVPHPTSVQLLGGSLAAGCLQASMPAVRICPPCCTVMRLAHIHDPTICWPQRLRMWVAVLTARPDYLLFTIVFCYVMHHCYHNAPLDEERSGCGIMLE
jgi:hypothetical protein